MSLGPLQPATFYAELEAHYPASFVDAGHLLRRAVEGEDLYQLDARRSSFLMRWFLESRALKLLRDRRVVDRRPHSTPARQARATSYDVLGLLLPARRDYTVLIAPSLQELRRRGRRVAVIAENAASLDPRLLKGLDVFSLEEWATLRTYRLARARYGRLAVDRVRLERLYDLGQPERRNVALTLQAQAWQQQAFAALLAALEPRAIVGLQFTLFPGVATALREHRSAGGATFVFLIQHGVFSGAWPEHDFRGADLLLTWGRYFSDELASFPGPHPPSAVVGHPRLEELANSMPTTRESGSDAAYPDASRRYRILYLGTNGVEADDTAAVQLVARSLSDTERLDVRYRPHPNEPMRKYEELVASGQLRAEQVVRDSDSYHELLQADLVLGTQTTMLPEALALGIPAIQVCPERFKVDWHMHGMASASEPIALERLVRAVLSEPEVRRSLLEAGKTLADRMFSDPRGVTERLASTIESRLAPSA